MIVCHRRRVYFVFQQALARCAPCTLGMLNLDKKLIEQAKAIQRMAEKQAEREGKAYIGSLKNCEIMVTVLISPRGNRHVYYYLNGRRAHKARVLKLIVKLLALKKKSWH